MFCLHQVTSSAALIVAPGARTTNASRRDALDRSLNQDDVARGSAVADRHRRDVVPGCVPPPSVVGARKLNYDEPPRLPVPLQRFVVSAADKEASVERLERPRHERGVLPVGRWVVDIDVGDHIRGHPFSFPGRAGQRNPTRGKTCGNLCRDVWRCTGQHGDRKSTRLNSSHVEISYAVFCLKKKNPPPSNGTKANQQTPTNRRTL